MSSEHRFLLIFQRLVFVAALCVTGVAATGCGEETLPPDSPSKNRPDDDGADVDGADVDGADVDGADVDGADVDGADSASDDESADDGSADDESAGDVRDGGSLSGRKDGGTPDASKGRAQTDASSSTRDDAGEGDPGPAMPPRGDDPTEASVSKAGPYEVKIYTDGYPDAPGYADSTIHYPEGATPPFASVAIVPGFVSPQSSIQTWGPFFASHGIVAMTIGTNTPGDTPPIREIALWDAVGTLKGENTRSGSPLKGKLALDKMGIMGWSMGGGGALLGGEKHPELKAIIALCPWNPGYSYGKISQPALFLATQVDVLAGGQSQPFYDSIPASVPKLLWERAGMGHWDNNDPAQENGAVGRYGLSWLKVYLEGDKRYRTFLEAMPPNASDHKANLN